MRKQRSIRLREHVDEAVEQLARQTGKDFSAIVNELLDEGLKMRRIPGILFASEGPRREAKIAGTGLGVWEIVREYRNVDGDWERFREGWHWLREAQLRSALAFAEAYPEEIDDRIAIDEAWTPERTYALYPFMRPPHQA